MDENISLIQSEEDPSSHISPCNPSSPVSGNSCFSAVIVDTFFIAYLTLFVISIVGNSFLLFVITLSEKTMMNILIASKTIAGMMLSVFAMFFYYVSIANSSSWVGGWFFCKTAKWFHSSVTMAISFSIVAMGYRKFKVVTKEMSGRWMREKMAWVGLIWGMAIFIAFPHIFTTALGIQQDILTCETCCCLLSQDNMLIKIYISAITFFEYFIPAILIVTTHALIWYKIRQKTNGKVVAVSGTGDVVVVVAGGDTDEDDVSERKEAKMLTTVATIFISFFLPWYFIITILLHNIDLELSGRAYFLFLDIAHMLGLACVALCPVVYFMKGSKFREVVWRMWLQLKMWRWSFVS
ncbi:hypothetical protein HELRODRAFT_159850 [Helobdella robusta]|uniref:G-protein coupled receptors family 1 profile domain-containing protein n=1 Tax=Helobdella robusta TaxID=6412 RepID=T1EPH0_HELRO|nr:hypothetical protein HELRODRAFT_159850 [Helobdella robusta]ESO13216.1 hypothetical protein HELRODRAFT_159850 [Helobdella robusta]